MITRKNLLALAVSTSLAATLVACGGDDAKTKIDEAAKAEVTSTADKSSMEGKCGGDKAKEGKCGGDKAKEGKCGGDKAKEGKCGGDKAKAKDKEGKCGEGKCGGDKK